MPLVRSIFSKTARAPAAARTTIALVTARATGASRAHGRARVVANVGSEER